MNNRILALLPLIGACDRPEQTLLSTDTAVSAPGDEELSVDEAAPFLRIRPIPHQETSLDVPLEVTVELLHPSADTVQISATSSNEDVLPNGAVAWLGTGSERTLTVTPIGLGDTTLHLEAVDSDGLTATLDVSLTAVINREAWVGVKQWSDGGASTVAQDLDIAPDGTVFTAGYSKPDARYRSWVSKHRADGSTEWTGLHDIALDSMGRRITALDDGSVLLATQAKLNPSSNQQFIWVGQWGPSGGIPTERTVIDYWDGPGDYSVPGDMHALSDGTLAIAGNGHKTMQQSRVDRISPSGDHQATMLSSGMREHRGTMIHVYGDLTAFGMETQDSAFGEPAGDGYDAWVGVLDSAGSTVWQDRIGGYGDQWVMAGEHDAQGNLYVCGGSASPVDPDHVQLGTRDVFVRKYDPSGAILWTHQLGADHYNACNALHVGRNQQLYIAGYWELDPAAVPMTGRAFVAAIDLRRGGLRWMTEVSPPSGGDTRAQAVRQSGADVIVGGTTTGTFPGALTTGPSSAWLARLSESGTLR